jgi:hypothetical protein
MQKHHEGYVPLTIHELNASKSNQRQEQKGRERSGSRQSRDQKQNLNGERRRQGKSRPGQNRKRTSSSTKIVLERLVRTGNLHYFMLI